MKLTLKILGVIAALALLVFFGLTYYVMNTIKNNSERDNSITYSLIQNKTVFKNLETNKTYTINTLQNDTTYYFHFWATYCKPCIKEFDDINANYNRIFKGKTKLLVISFEDEQKITNFLKNKNYKLPFYKADSTQFFIKPNIEIVPTTIVVKNNKVIDKGLGTINWAEIN